MTFLRHKTLRGLRDSSRKRKSARKLSSLTSSFLGSQESRQVVVSSPGRTTAHEFVSSVASPLPSHPPILSLDCQKSSSPILEPSEFLLIWNIVSQSAIQYRIMTGI